MLQEPRGQLFVVSAPSGVGKTTIIRSVRAKWPDLEFSVSSTTRPPRTGETPGHDYHFISRDEFLQGLKAERFLEWARVHGEYYGTDRQQIEAWLAAGRDVLLDIDVQGTRQVRSIYPHAQTIFILPPSMDVLEQRLRARGTESPEQLARRLANAKNEVQEASCYDFLIVNDALEEAVADLEAVLRACHCLRAFQARRLKPFLFPMTFPEEELH